MTAELRIGTSGYSFADWVGTVYPPGTRPGGFLPFYAKLFDAVEINATYYRTPSPQTFARMVEKTPEGFTFVVKVPRAMTHELASFDRELEPFQRAIEPLAAAGRLGGLLAQFPYAFVPNDASRRHLERLARELGPGAGTARPPQAVASARHCRSSSATTRGVTQRPSTSCATTGSDSSTSICLTSRTCPARARSRPRGPATFACTAATRRPGGTRRRAAIATTTSIRRASSNRGPRGSVAWPKRRTSSTSSPTTATSGRASSTPCN